MVDFAETDRIGFSELKLIVLLGFKYTESRPYLLSKGDDSPFE